MSARSAGPVLMTVLDTPAGPGTKPTGARGRGAKVGAEE